MKLLSIRELNTKLVFVGFILLIIFLLCEFNLIHIAFNVKMSNRERAIADLNQDIQTYRRTLLQYPIELTALIRYMPKAREILDDQNFWREKFQLKYPELYDLIKNEEVPNWEVLYNKIDIPEEGYSQKIPTRLCRSENRAEQILLDYYINNRAYPTKVLESLYEHMTRYPLLVNRKAISDVVRLLIKDENSNIYADKYTLDRMREIALVINDLNLYKDLNGPKYDQSKRFSVKFPVRSLEAIEYVANGHYDAFISDIVKVAPDVKSLDNFITRHKINLKDLPSSTLPKSLDIFKYLLRKNLDLNQTSSRKYQLNAAAQDGLYDIFMYLFKEFNIDEITEKNYMSTFLSDLGYFNNILSTPIDEIKEVLRGQCEILKHIFSYTQLDKAVYQEYIMLRLLKSIARLDSCQLLIKDEVLEMLMILTHNLDVYIDPNPLEYFKKVREGIHSLSLEHSQYLKEWFLLDHRANVTYNMKLYGGCYSDEDDYTHYDEFLDDEDYDWAPVDKPIDKLEQVLLTKRTMLLSLRHIHPIKSLSRKEKIEAMYVLRDRNQLDSNTARAINNPLFIAAYGSPDKELAKMLEHKFRELFGSGGNPLTGQLNSAAAAALYADEIGAFKDVASHSTIHAWINSNAQL